MGAVRKEYGNKAPREYTITGAGIRALSDLIAVTDKMRSELVSDGLGEASV